MKHSNVEPQLLTHGEHFLPNFDVRFNRDHASLAHVRLLIFKDPLALGIPIGQILAKAQPNSPPVRFTHTAIRQAVIGGPLATRANAGAPILLKS